MRKMVTLHPTWRTVIKANCEWSYFKILCKKTNKQKTIIKIFIYNKTFIIFGGQLSDCPELDHVFLPTLGYLKKKLSCAERFLKPTIWLCITNSGYTSNTGYNFDVSCCGITGCCSIFSVPFCEENNCTLKRMTEDKCSMN